jgi:DNA-binding MarR family transcriptional regulator
MKLKAGDRNRAVNPPQREADQAAAELMEAMPAIMQFMRTEMRNQREPSLSVPQFRVLAFLNLHPNASLSEVADHIGITRASASTMVDRLVQRGLVDRQEDPSERRHIMLKITPTGSNLLESMRNSTRQTIADLLNKLTPEELNYISAGLVLLGQVFNTANTLQ